MCYHRLFIYTTCGHSIFSRRPLVLCDAASLGHADSSCRLIAHPFQSWKLNSLCTACADNRTVLLDRIDVSEVIKYDEWRWKVSYGMPKHGKDFWGRKVEEREKLEKETGKRTTKVMWWNWRKRRYCKES